MLCDFFFCWLWLERNFLKNISQNIFLPSSNASQTRMDKKFKTIQNIGRKHKMTKEVKKLRQWLAYSNFAWKSSWILITSLDLWWGTDQGKQNKCVPIGCCQIFMGHRKKCKQSQKTHPLRPHSVTLAYPTLEAEWPCKAPGPVFFLLLWLLLGSCADCWDAEYMPSSARPGPLCRICQCANGGKEMSELGYDFEAQERNDKWKYQYKDFSVGFF